MTLIIIGLAILSIGLVYYYFYDMGRLPKGTFQNSYDSPNGSYTLNIYLCEGTLSAPAIRGELNYNFKNKKNRNIYWNYDLDNVHVYWKTDDIVVIDGIILDVTSDVYDFRRRD